MDEDIDISVADFDPGSVDVTVTIEVNIGGQLRRKTTSALTDANPYKVAEGLLDGLDGDTGHWLREQGRLLR